MEGVNSSLTILLRELVGLLSVFSWRSQDRMPPPPRQDLAPAAGRDCVGRVACVRAADSVKSVQKGQTSSDGLGRAWEASGGCGGAWAGAGRAKKRVYSPESAALDHSAKLPSQPQTGEGLVCVFRLCSFRAKTGLFPDSQDVASFNDSCEVRTHALAEQRFPSSIEQGQLITRIFFY